MEVLISSALHILQGCHHLWRVLRLTETLKAQCLLTTGLALAFLGQRTHGARMSKMGNMGDSTRASVLSPKTWVNHDAVSIGQRLQLSRENLLIN